MARCTRTQNLEVHHLRRDGGNKIDNAQVLCQECHYHTSSYGTQGMSPSPFSKGVKETAKIRASFQCECTSRGCH